MRHRALVSPLLLAFAGASLLFFTRATAEAPEQQTAEAARPRPEFALFAGGCFWCMEKPFDALEGVFSTTSGYTGGKTENPTYEEVSAGGTGHAEVVRVAFDPRRVSYEQLLEVFWRNIDPLTADRQFCDRGNQYRSAIFTLGEQQKAAALKSREALAKKGGLPGPIVTEITEAGTFYPAEDYHQDYYRKNPIRYRFYRSRCGRDARLEELWGPARK